MGSGNLLVIIRGAFGNSYKGVQSVLEMTFFLGSASVALVQVLTLTDIAIRYQFMDCSQWLGWMVKDLEGT